MLARLLFLANNHYIRVIPSSVSPVLAASPRDTTRRFANIILLCLCLTPPLRFNLYKPLQPGSGRSPPDLAQLGQTTHVARSTLSQVRQRIQQLRESTASKVTAKNYDFQARLAEVRSGQDAERTRRREERKRKRAGGGEDEELGRVGVMKRAKAGEGEGGTGAVNGAFGDVDRAQRENEGIAEMMGFGGFGGGKKR